MIWEEGFRKLLCLGVAAALFSAPSFAEDHNRGPAAIDDSPLASECFTKGTTPHVCALMRLAQVETAIDEELDKVVAEFASDDPKNKLNDNPVYLKRLNAVAAKWEKVANKIRAEITDLAQKQKRTSLQLIANFEIPRMIVDLKSRLAIMALPDREASKLHIADANRSMQSIWAAFKSIPAKHREDTPGLLNRLVETRLNVLELEQNSSSDASRLEGDRKIREVRDFIADARDLKPNPVETAELDMTEVESYLSHAESRGLGGRFLRAPQDYRDEDRLDKLVKNLSKHAGELAATPGQEHIVAQAKLLDIKARFYSRDHQAGASAYLEASLKSSDLVSQQVAIEAMGSIFSEFSGLGASRDIALIADRNSAVHGLDAQAFTLEYSRRAMAHNKSIDESLGAEMAQKMKLPSYQRIMEHQAELGDPYMRLINSFGRLGQRLEAVKQSGGSDDDVKTAMASVDLDWIDLQCSLISVKQTLRPGDPGLRIKSPLAGYNVDFSPCLAANNRRSINKIIHQISIKAVNKDLYKSYAWLIGNFAFDVTTIALTGGVGTAISKSVQAGFRVAGKAMLRHMAQKAAVKAGVRGAAFATKLVVGDIAGQTMGGVKTFVAVGLQDGEWDTSNLKPGFLKGDFKPHVYALRLMAGQFATKAPWAVFGRASKYAMKSDRMQKVMAKIGNSREKIVAGTRDGLKSTGTKLIAEPVKGQINDISKNGAESALGLAEFKGFENVTSVDNWLTRYRGLLLGLPGGKLGGAFSDKLRSLPPKYYGELSKAGKCLTANSAVASR